MIRRWLKKIKAGRHFHDGTIQSLQGKYERSIETLSKAIELDPGNLEAYLNRGIAFINSGNSKRAITDLSFIVQKNPEEALAYYNRSIAYMELNQNDLALADMNQAIHLAPEDANNYNHRCIIHSHRKEYDLAIADATKAIELGSERAGHNNRAVVFTHSGDYVAAIADWTKVIQIDPNNLQAYCRRGILYERIGKIEAAMLDLKKGLKKKDKLPPKFESECEELLYKLEVAQKSTASRG